MRSTDTLDNSPLFIRPRSPASLSGIDPEPALSEVYEPDLQFRFYGHSYPFPAQTTINFSDLQSLRQLSSAVDMLRSMGCFPRFSIGRSSVNGLRNYSLVAANRGDNQGIGTRQVASLLDLTASQLKTIQQRAEAKDYRDVAAALDAGTDLAEALGAATAVFGKRFNAMAALKALTYFGDGNLPSLPQMIQDRLRTSAEALKLEALPQARRRPSEHRSQNQPIPPSRRRGPAEKRWRGQRRRSRQSLRNLWTDKPLP